MAHNSCGIPDVAAIMKKGVKNTLLRFTYHVGEEISSIYMWAYCVEICFQPLA